MDREQPARKENYFDPHFWQRCFVFRCRAGCCPFVADCYASRQRDRKLAEETVHALNRMLAEGSTLEELMAGESRLEVEHLVESHGVVMDRGANRLAFMDRH